VIVAGLFLFFLSGCSHGYQISQRERIEVRRSEPPVEVVNTFLSALSSSNEEVLHRIAEPYLYRTPAIRAQLLMWTEKSTDRLWTEQFLKEGKAVVILNREAESSTNAAVPRLWLVDTSRTRGSHYAWRVIRFDPGKIRQYIRQTSK